MVRNFSPLYIIMLAVIACFLSCGNKTEDMACNCADSFATHYFNWQYEQCLPFTSAESKTWLQFAASNVTQSDIDMLRAMEYGASVEVTDIEMNDDGNATAELLVSHFLMPGRLGKEAALIEEATTTLTLKKQDEDWKVILEALPKMAFPQQSEEQNPDSIAGGE